MMEHVAKERDVMPGRSRTTYVCNTVRLSYGACQRILSYQRNVRRTAANFVPRLLSNAQKEYRTAVCTEPTEQAENDPNFICIIIIGDESWVFGYDPEANQQSSQWTQTSPRPKKARQLRSNVKSMLIFFTLEASCIRNLFHQDRL